MQSCLLIVCGHSELAIVFIDSCLFVSLLFKAISNQELDYILQNREARPQTSDPDAEKEAVPWAKFFKSSAFWGLICAHFAYNWGTYVVASWLPTYFDSMFNVDYKGLGFFGMLPYIALGLVANLGGTVADHLHNSGMSMLTVRKLMNTTGFVLPAICFLLLATLKKCSVGSDLWHSQCSDFYCAAVLLTLGLSDYIKHMYPFMYFSSYFPAQVSVSEASLFRVIGSISQTSRLAIRATSLGSLIRSRPSPVSRVTSSQGPFCPGTKTIGGSSFPWGQESTSLAHSSSSSLPKASRSSSKAPLGTGASAHARRGQAPAGAEAHWYAGPCRPGPPRPH